MGLERSGHYDRFCLATWMIVNGIRVVQVNPYVAKQTKEVEDNRHLEKRGLAAVPNVTSPAVNRPVLPWQDAAENAAALPDPSQPALPGGDTTAGVGIEGEVGLLV